MPFSDDIIAQNRDPAGSLLLSLKDKKAANLAQSYANKTAAIDPVGLVSADLLDRYNSRLQESSGGGSLLDFAKSSGYSALGNLGDAGRSISNSQLGSNFDNSQETGWSNQVNADRAAGLSSAARDKFNADTQAVYQNIADGNTLDAIGGSLALGPRVLADSAATIPEALAGAALTATGIGSTAGLAILGNKGRKAAKVFSNVKKGIDAAKKNSKAAKLVANSLRSASNTSIMTADMVQQQVHDYKKENNGESPSGPRVASMILGNTAANMLQVDILKKFYVPLKGKINPSLAKFKGEAKNLLSYAEEGTLKSLTKTVAAGVPKVLAAAGAEGAQEYIQSWVEILGVKVKPDEAGGLLASAYKEITDEGNRNKAVLGMMLGGAAGGTAKAAIGAPAVALKGTADVAKGVTRATGRALQTAGDKAALAVMSEEDISNIKTDYKAQKAVAEESIANLTSRIDTVSKASDFETLKADPEIAAFVQAYQEAEGVTDEDLQSDPKALKSIKDKIIRQHKSDRFKIYTEFKGSGIANAVKIIKDNAIKGIKTDLPDSVKSALSDISEEDVNGIEAEYSKQKGLTSSKVAELKEKMSKVASSVAVGELLSDPSLKVFVDKYKEDNNLKLRDIASSDSHLEAIKADIAKDYTSQVEAVNSKFSSSDIRNKHNLVKQRTSKGVSGKVYAAAKLIKESDPDTVIGSLKGLSKAAVDTIKSIKSGTALGIIEMSANVSVDTTKTAVEAAKGLSLSDIEKTASVLKDNNPKTAKALTKVYNDIKNAKGRFGIATDNIVDSETLPSVISEVAKASEVTQAQASATVVNLTKAVTGNIADVDTLNTIKKAVEVYENSNIDKNLESLARIKKRIEHAERKLASKGKVSEVVDSVKSVISGLESESLSDKFKGTKIHEKLTDLMETDTAKDASTKAKSILKDLKSVNSDEVVDRFSKSLQKIVDINIGKGKEEVAGKAEPKTEEVKPESKPSTSSDVEALNRQKLALAGVSSVAKKNVAAATTDKGRTEAFDKVLALTKKEMPNPDVSVLEAFTTTFGKLTDEQIDTINKHYPPASEDSNIQTREEFDSIPTKDLAEPEIESLYVEANPGCKPK